MECLQDPLIWLFFASLAFLVLQRRSHGNPPLPPRPKPLPIISNMLMGDQFTHRGLAVLAKRYGGLLHLRVGSLRIFVVSTPDLAREVLQTQDTDFSHRPATAAVRYLTYGLSDLALAHSGSTYWRQMRKLCATKLFSRRRPETWLAVHDGYGALARAVGKSNGEAMNLGDLIFSHTVRVIFRAAFSTVYDDHGLEKFVSMFPEFSKLLEAFYIGDFFPWLGWMGRRGFQRRLRTAREALGEFLDKIIDEHVTRSKNPNDADADADMVDGLLAFVSQANQARGNDGEDGPCFTRDNVKAVMMDMLFGGPDTIGATIEWAMAEMIRSPEILLRLQQELADVVGLDRIVDESDLDKLLFLKCVVKETFRMHPPIPMHLHGTTKDCVLGGYSVPSGSRVLINAWAIGRDGEVWKDVDAFWPSRFMPGEGEAARLDLKGGCYEFLPFGAGRRSCPAQGLGPYAVEFAVATLAHGFQWELPDGMNPAELDMGDLFGVTVSRAKRLCAVPKPRLTCSL
ncbi:hypothetical protein ACQ4PT_005756 [Festuca glaucescens]